VLADSVGVAPLGRPALVNGAPTARRRRAGRIRRMSALECGHLDQIAVTELPGAIDGCEECLKIGSRWVHLRMCMTCGKIGCCDQSPNRHARRHATEAEHPIIRSAQPGEDWSWCFVDDLAFVIAPASA